MVCVAVQVLLREWRRLQGEVEAVMERVGLLGEVVHTDALHQQVAELSRHAEELQQRAKARLLNLQDAAKVTLHTHTHTVLYLIMTSAPKLLSP